MNDDPSPAATQAVLSLPAAISLLILFFLLGALFALCESAVNAASESRVKKDAEAGVPRAKRFSEYLEQDETFASPLQFGMMLAGFFAVGASVVGFVPMLDDVLTGFGMTPLPAALLATLLMTLLCSVLFLTVSDFVPKKLIAHLIAKDIKNSYRLVGLIRALSRGVYPLMKLCDLISDGAMRLLGHDPRALEDVVTEEEILHMVGEGEELGVIEEDERDIIENVFEFNDTTVGEIMTHRTEICAVNEDTSIADVAAIAVEEGFSRLPVYGEDIDTITGICYVKDLLPYIGAPVPEDAKLASLVRPAYFVPESKKLDQLFKEFQAKRLQIAVVVDEYGGTAGIITLEDLVESIFGSIQDEFDDEEEDVFQVSENELAVEGTMSIDEVSDLVDVDLPEGDYDTIAGLVTELLGYLPKANEHPSVTVCGLRITVLRVEEQRLKRLLIVKIPKEDEEKEE